MAEAARITPINEQSAQDQTQKAQDTGRNQLPGESNLWFRRYCLYRDLGHKRTYRAAVAKEQETAHVVKEAETATKSTEKPKTGKGQKVSDPVIPSAPKGRPVQVPGSWKHASKVYRWAERTASYDQWVLNRMVTTTYARMGESFANKYRRVQTLETLIKTTLEQQSALASDGKCTPELFLAFVKQAAALLRQMESEMNGSESEMRMAIEAYGKTMIDDIEKAFRIGQTVVVKQG